MHLAESAGEVEIKGNVKCYNKGGGGGGRALVLEIQVLTLLQSMLTG